MKIKKILALALTVAVVLSMLVMPASAASLKDLNDAPWASDSIERWVDAEVIGGYPDGTFNPNGSITRAEFATILAKAFGLSSKGGTTFSDVERVNHWAKDYIYACAAAGIVTGYTDGTFGSDNPITRQEAMAMFVRALKLYTYVDAEDYADFLKNEFADASQVAEWAEEYAVAMVNNNAMQGSVKDDGIYLNPTANISRAEVAVILDRVVAAYVSAKGDVSSTTQAQIDKGMMGDRIVVHTDADATVMGNGEDGFVVEGANDAIELTGFYEVRLLNGNAKNWVYFDEGYAITDGEYLHYYSHHLYDEFTHTYIYYHEDDTKTENSRSTVYSYNDENWNLEEVRYYEDGELYRTRSCEFDELGRPSKVYEDEKLERSYEYDEKGNIAVEIRYDDEGRVSGNFEYTYNSDGNLLVAHEIYYSYQIEYQYDENGDLIVDDEGNPVEVEVKSESVCDYKYTYDEFGNETSYQCYNDDGNLYQETLYTYDENGSLTKEHYKYYSFEYESEGTVRYLSNEDIYVYGENGSSYYEWISYDPAGKVLNHDKNVMIYNETGRQIRRDEYFLNVETGKLELYGSIYYEYDEDEGYRTAYYFKSVDGTVHWKYEEERKESEEDYVYTERYYEEGELVYTYVQERKYETSESWDTEYNSKDEVTYKRYSYNEYEDGMRHYHSEYQQHENENNITDEYYYVVLLPETYRGSDWAH